MFVHLSSVLLFRCPLCVRIPLIRFMLNFACHINGSQGALTGTLTYFSLFLIQIELKTCSSHVNPSSRKVTIVINKSPRDLGYHPNGLQNCQLLYGGKMCYDCNGCLV